MQPPKGARGIRGRSKDQIDAKSTMGPCGGWHHVIAELLQATVTSADIVSSRFPERPLFTLPAECNSVNAIATMRIRRAEAGMSDGEVSTQARRGDVQPHTQHPCVKMIACGAACSRCSLSL